MVWYIEVKFLQQTGEEEKDLHLGEHIAQTHSSAFREEGTLLDNDRKHTTRLVHTHGEGNEVFGLRHSSILQKAFWHKVLRIVPQVGTHVEGVQVRQNVSGCRNRVASQNRVTASRLYS